MKHCPITPMHWLLVAALAAICAACASIGRPQGGPKDTTPPVLVRSNPASQERNVSRNTISLFFDENVQLQDAFNKVIVSPVQINSPVVSSNGRRVTVELKDTLLPNTTYTIDFGDAIKDLNEGNILDGYTHAFSTGDSIDSLRIAGIVLEARTLEPAQGILVGAYLEAPDSAITTMPFDRVSRTNQFGQFTLHNLKPGRYSLYALKDMNRDYKWDRSEDVAFLDSAVVPFAVDIEVTDTLRGSDGLDSLSVRAGNAFFPNDVLLTWFNEGYQSQYLKDYNRTERHRITMNMGAPADTLPIVTIADGAFKGKPIDDWALLEKSAKLDSLTYWISDTAVLAVDSLLLSVSYLRTDTADMLTWRTDTLKFFFKDKTTKEKEKKKKKEEEEADTMPPPVVYMDFALKTKAPHEVYMPVVLEAGHPIDSVRPDGYRLEILVDTLWQPVAGAVLAPDSLMPLRRLVMDYKWKPGEKYRLTVDSAAVTGIYGLYNKSFKHEFNVKELEEYSNLVFNVSPLDSLPAMVELLDRNDNVIAFAPVVDGHAEFKYLNPADVYARLYIDANGNGQWDTGNMQLRIQPEETYYFPKKIKLKKNWDIAQDWNIYEQPVDVQKPWDIKKNKPKLKAGEKYPGQPDDDEESEDEFGSDPFVPGNNPFDPNSNRKGYPNGTNSRF